MNSRPQSWRDMSAAPRLFIAVVVICGTAVLTYSVMHGQSLNPLKFFCYLVIALAASRLKVNLPGITGTMSVNFLFLLLGVLELSLSEAMALGCAAVVVQCFDRDRPVPIQVAFNVCSTALAIAVTFVAYHFSALHRAINNPSTLLFLAATIYFVANTLPVAAVISLTERRSLRKIWSDCYFWSFPYYLVGAGVAGMMSWLHGFTDWQTSLLTLPVVYLIYRSYRLYLGKLEDEKRHVEEMADLHMRTIEALALAIEAKDQTTHDHLQRVRVYAVEVAKELKVGRDEMEALQAAALLHDIGKLAIPEHIISKPGRLTPEEFEKMKIHPLVGAEILERVAFPYPVVPIVRAHHEKFDGSGYPLGLKGDTDTHWRAHSGGGGFPGCPGIRPAIPAGLPLNEAMLRLSAESGKSFDPTSRFRARTQIRGTGTTGPCSAPTARASRALYRSRGEGDLAPSRPSSRRLASRAQGKPPAAGAQFPRLHRRRAPGGADSIRTQPGSGSFAQPWRNTVGFCREIAAGDAL